MKKYKTIFAIILMCIIVMGIFFAKNSIKVAEIQTVMDAFDNVSVEVINDPLVTKSSNREIVYTLKNKDCHIRWNFSEISYGGKKHMYVKLDYPYQTKCVLSFKDQIPFHEHILKRAFKDWNYKKVKSILTSSFQSMNPTMKWNQAIIEAGLKSKKLAEYKRLYPNHNPRYSINRIFVELANEKMAYKGIIELFKNLGLRVKLKDCEKVFSANQSSLKALGLKLKKYKTIIYDAGMMVFSVEKQ